jgi:hypothetical protein
MLRGWKTYIAAAGLLLTGIAKYMGHEIDMSGLLQTAAEALAVAGFRDALTHLLAKKE